MRKTFACAAIAATTLFAVPALAQSASAPADAAPPPSSSSATTPSAASSGADASVTTGMSVKDKTGTTIGQVTDVKAGADGKTTATIKMGADTFAVDAANLAVANGSATVNASQDEIKQMLKK